MYFNEYKYATPLLSKHNTNAIYLNDKNKIVNKVNIFIFCGAFNANLKEKKINSMIVKSEAT